VGRRGVDEDEFVYHALATVDANRDLAEIDGRPIKLARSEVENPSVTLRERAPTLLRPTKTLTSSAPTIPWMGT